ncbi:hypothetical protein SAMN04488523_10611 [Sulfitobacter brevis]|uniref:Uncharacterized protein n=1 Tax=Sulfitobacter brevis TaxID=74348 RepID=A0A1I1Z425_9RHOB|nr:hypothetical protein [Sulfitobacter brevis]SFE25070.1 hypothetical protein SAMN04488523_10611 [Sulfitobacter brevis]
MAFQQTVTPAVRGADFALLVAVALAFIAVVYIASGYRIVRSNVAAQEIIISGEDWHGNVRRSPR